MKQFGIFIAGSFSVAVLAFAGCSSSSSNGGTTTGKDGGKSSGSSSGSSSGGTSSSSSSSSGGSSSSGVSGIDSGDDGSDGAPECFDGTSGYTALTTAPAPVKALNSCSSTDISTFITDCVTGSSVTDCNNWFATNVPGNAPDGGGAGSACGNCIFPVDNQGNPTNTGATYTITIGSGSNEEGFFGPNYGGCVQLKDPTHGAACALAMDNASNCEQQACALDGDAQCSATDYSACVTYATGAGQGCNAAYNSQSACVTDDADGGAAQICSPTGGTNQTTDFTFVINTFCGAG